MKVEVKIFSGGAIQKIIEICENSTYEGLLESLGINPEVVIIFRNGTPVPLDENVSPDNIEIVRVVTGG